jgi:hypothetical protein
MLVQLLPCGQHSTALIPVLFNVKQLLFGGQHQLDGRSTAQFATRFAAPQELESCFVKKLMALFEKLKALELASDANCAVRINGI